MPIQSYRGKTFGESIPPLVSEGLKVPWTAISNKSNQNEECHASYSMTNMSKISVNFSPQKNTCIIS